jgi:hypothetical protein
MTMQWCTPRNLDRILRPLRIYSGWALARYGVDSKLDVATVTEPSQTKTWHAWMRQS